MKKELLLATIAIVCISGCDVNLDIGPDESTSGDVTNPYGVHSHRNAAVPKAWSKFCARYNQPIASKDYGKRFQDLREIFHPLFDNFDHVEDIDHWGVEEQWDIMPDDDLRGDCEDFALTLRARLIRNGFPMHDVRIATCHILRKGKPMHHAVALVEVDRGDVYVVDPSGIYKFKEYRVVSWNKVLDESGIYWVMIDNIPGTIKL